MHPQHGGANLSAWRVIAVGEHCGGSAAPAAILSLVSGYYGTEGRATLGPASRNSVGRTLPAVSLVQLSRDAAPSHHARRQPQRDVERNVLIENRAEAVTA
jgi:hypothetical protein